MKIAEFATAIGDGSPLCRDRAAAQAAGHPDVVAPPTFAIVITAVNSARLIADPDLGVNYAMVVHGEQNFAYDRPLRAGDVVVTEASISGIRSIGRNERMDVQTIVKTVDGEHICTSHNVLIERGA